MGFINMETLRSSHKYDLIAEEAAPEVLDLSSFKLSVIVPCFNEQETLNYSYKKIIDVLEEVKNIEIIFIDDGSLMPLEEIYLT